MDNYLLYQRLLDKERKPSKEKIQKTIGKTAKSAWNSLQRFINKNYDLMVGHCDIVKVEKPYAVFFLKKERFLF